MKQRSSYAFACWLWCVAGVACGSAGHSARDQDDVLEDDADGGAGGSGGDVGAGGMAGASAAGGNNVAGAGGSNPAGGSAGGAAATGGVAGGSSLPSDRAIKIQPLGDSITQGRYVPEDPTWIEYTYRRPLWLKLKAANYNVDFVGSLDTQLGGVRDPRYNDFDFDHEARYGISLAEVLQKIDEYMADYTPDVSLIHLGTNDRGTADVRIANMEKLIGKLREHNPRIVILVAQIIRAGGEGALFNTKLPALAQRLSTVASPIVVVNQAEGFLASDTVPLNGIHPNPSGSEKMATKWYDALVKLLPAPK